MRRPKLTHKKHTSIQVMIRVEIEQCEGNQELQSNPHGVIPQLSIYMGKRKTKKRKPGWQPNVNKITLKIL